MTTNSKDAIFCVKCGEKNATSSAFCTNCGTELVHHKKKEDEDLQKKREEEKRLNQVTLKNMPSKISSATFIAAKVIVKTSIVSLKPKQPTRYDSESTKVFIVLSGTLRYAHDVTDEVKRKILEDVGTDLDIKQVEWFSSSLASSRLNDKGWHAISNGGQWYMWPMNGSTIKTLITVNYMNGKPSKDIVKGGNYSQDNLSHDQTSEAVWTVIGFIAFIIFIIWLIAK